MQHLNYCRQVLTAFVDGEVGILPLEGTSQDQANANANLAFSFLKKSMKFSLPHDGRTMNDLELRGLGGLRIELPYKCVSLEYYADQSHVQEEYSASKRIVLAVDGFLPSAHDPNVYIVVVSLYFLDFLKKWFISPPVFVHKEEYSYIEDGTKKLLISSTAEVSEAIKNEYIDEVFVLLDFLNALACKNVHIEKSPSRATKQGKKVKAALPFDDYNFLTIDVPGKAGVRSEGLGGSQRSPREHLRRGHIRLSLIHI